MSELNIGTKCVQGGYTPGNGEPRQIPIIQSTTFKYATSEDMGKLFDLEAEGYFYSRLQNPTWRHRRKKDMRTRGRNGRKLYRLWTGGVVLQRVQHSGLRRPRGFQLDNLRRNV